MPAIETFIIVIIIFFFNALFISRENEVMVSIHTIACHRNSIVHFIVRLFQNVV